MFLYHYFYQFVFFEENEFIIGERVKVRNAESRIWKIGAVSDKYPTKVKLDDWLVSHEWIYVEKVSNIR